MSSTKVDPLEDLRRWAILDEDPFDEWDRGYSAARRYVRMQLAAAEQEKDVHSEHWQIIAKVGEAINRSPTCGPEQAKEFCCAIDRLADALMR